MYALTGAHVDHIFHEQVRNNHKLWQRILRADQKKYVIASAANSRRSGLSREVFDSMGIVDAHAYSLLMAMSILTDSMEKERLIQLRNPWGFEEWKGKWSDYDTENWTQALKEKYVSNKRDGIFFINLDDYLKFYYNTTICKYQDTEYF